MLTLREFCMDEIENVKAFYRAVFTGEPWNDDWSDDNQLHQYILDMMGNRNSLSLGLYEEDRLVGLSLGNIVHWYMGTEYYITELCIKTSEQGRGLGTQFMQKIEKYIKEKGIKSIFLQTERNMPAYDFYQKNGFYELKEHVSLAKELK